MNEKDRFDALVKLADFRFARWLPRREAEWKITLGLWAVFLTAPISVAARPHLFWLGVIYTIVVIAYIVLWAWPIVIRNMIDIRTAFYYMGLAEELILHGEERAMVREAEKDGPPNQKAGLLEGDNFKKSILTWSSWTTWFQIATTTLIALCSLWLFATKPELPPSSPMAPPSAAVLPPSK